MAKLNELYYSNRYSEYNKEDALWIATEYNNYLKELNQTEEQYPFDLWFDTESNNVWQRFMDELEESENNRECVLTGFVDLWNGKKEIDPVIYTNVCEAIIACTQNKDYVTIRKVNGCVEIKATHHDGTNVYKINLLNEKGLKAIDKGTKADLSNKRYHKAMTKYLT